MTIFNALTMLGGLCLFLFGMNVMGEALERRAGNGLRTLIGRITDRPVMGFLTGQCMKLLRGKADPKQVSAALLEALR